MPKFFYIARNREGQKRSGMEEASSQEEAISKIQAKDLIVINIIPEREEARQAAPPEIVAVGGMKPRHWHYGVKGTDLALFCRQLATLLGAGVTILKSLDIIAQQVSSRRLYSVIRDLQKKMEAGYAFYEALAKHPNIFSELWINLVESGEASGNLAVVLNRLASYLERNAEFKRKLISALMYPAVLFVVSTLALLFLTVKIIPTFAEIFGEFNMNLPFLTRVLIFVSDFVRKQMLFFLIILVLAFFMFKSYIKTTSGRRKYEALKFKLPIFGEFFRTLVIERFSSEMSTLIESGVPILYSLEIVEHSVDNLILGDIIRQIKEGVREGKSLSAPIEKSGFFDPMLTQMVSIGEEIGELSEMFKRLNAFYREAVETFLTRFTALFEPLMLVFMGVVVGIMVVGMFLPIFQLASIR